MFIRHWVAHWYSSGFALRGRWVLVNLYRSQGHKLYTLHFWTSLLLIVPPCIQEFQLLWYSWFSLFVSVFFIRVLLELRKHWLILYLLWFSMFSCIFVSAVILLFMNRFHSFGNHKFIYGRLVDLGVIMFVMVRVEMYGLTTFLGNLSNLEYFICLFYYLSRKRRVLFWLIWSL
jgi:hypothetical protein